MLQNYLSTDIINCPDMYFLQTSEGDQITWKHFSFSRKLTKISERKLFYYIVLLFKTCHLRSVQHLIFSSDIIFKDISHFCYYCYISFWTVFRYKILFSALSNIYFLEVNIFFSIEEDFLKIRIKSVGQFSWMKFR